MGKGGLFNIFLLLLFFFPLLYSSCFPLRSSFSDIYTSSLLSVCYFHFHFLNFSVSRSAPRFLRIPLSLLIHNPNLYPPPFSYCQPFFLLRYSSSRQTESSTSHHPFLPSMVVKKKRGGGEENIMYWSFFFFIFLRSIQRFFFFFLSVFLRLTLNFPA